MHKENTARRNARDESKQEGERKKKDSESRGAKVQWPVEAQSDLMTPRSSSSSCASFAVSLSPSRRPFFASGVILFDAAALLVDIGLPTRYFAAAYDGVRPLQRWHYGERRRKDGEERKRGWWERRRERKGGFPQYRYNGIDQVRTLLFRPSIDNETSDALSKRLRLSSLGIFRHSSAVAIFKPIVPKVEMFTGAIH